MAAVSLPTTTVTRRSFLGGCLAVTAFMMGCAHQTANSSTASSSANAGSNSGDISTLRISSDAWSYDSATDCYYQIGLPYCTNPQATAYESMAIYVPGAYFDGTQNSNGTYSCTVNEAGKAGSFTAKTAPVVFPVNTAGYSAQAAPTQADAQGVADYLQAGLVYVYAGCRGRANGTNDDGSAFAGGAPWGCTDLKAAVRCVRYNSDVLPGNMEKIVTFGMSGGGAQSAIMGASGDSSLYTPYLEAIGAVMQTDDGTAISDAIYGSMCWCPITQLDVADAAYEWMMGQYVTSGTRADGTFTVGLSKDLAATFASWVNSAGIESDGKTLALTSTDEGVYAAGSYYEAVKTQIEQSLNNFLADTEFPYTPSNTTNADGNFGGAGGSVGAGGGPGGSVGAGGVPGGSGEEPSGSNAPSGAPSDAGSSDSSGAPSGASGSDSAASTGGAPSGAGPNSQSDSASQSDADSTSYETVQDYIDALNASETWVTYDSASNTASVSSIGGFVRACKNPTKSVCAFDALDRSQGENQLFGTSAQDYAHFDETLAQLLDDNSATYAQLSGWDEAYPDDYEDDLALTDDWGSSMQTRANAYNPLYFILDSSEGKGQATVAPHWRIRTGIGQPDTSLTTELNLAWALQANKDVADVDFATVWGKKHTMAERTGSSTENFLTWVQDIA